MSKKKVIMVDEEVVNDLQAKDAAVSVSKEVVMQLMDMHKLDEDTTMLESPVFKAYEQQMFEKKQDFEKAKDAMAMKYIPSDIQNSVKDWSLNYYTRELTLTM